MFINTLNIFAKEFRSYFQSRMAWFVFIVYAALSIATTFYQSRFLSSSEPGLWSFFKLQADIWVLIIPALTIKLWTDEKRQGTLELTLSLPVSRTALVIGKFLAVWALCCLLLISTFGLWLSASFVTDVNNLAVLQNYIFCWLLCGVLCAVSLCASAFMAHPVSAFVVSLAVCLGFSMIDFAGLTAYLGFSSETLLRISSALNFRGRFDALIAGQLSFGTIFYFLSLSVFALWLNTAVIAWRQTASKQLGLFFAYLVLSFAALNIGVVLLCGTWTWDFSADKRFSLSTETKEWLKQNNNNLFARLYYSPKLKKTKELADVLRLLEQYRIAAGHKMSLWTVETEPLSAAEAEALKAGVRQTEKQPMFGIVISDNNGRFQTLPYIEPRRRSYLEHDISKALSSLGSYQPKNIGIMSPEFPVMASGNALDYQEDWPFAAILRQNYNLRPISAQTSVIPEDTDLLMIINPRNLSPVAIYAIDQYLMQGGSLLIFADPLSEAALASYNRIEPRFSLHGFLQNLGIVYNDQITQSKNVENSRPFWQEVSPQAGAHSLIAGLKPLALSSAGSFQLVSPETSSAQIVLASDNSEPRVLAVLREGNFTSVFEQALVNAETKGFLSISLHPGKVLLVADSDMLDSALWNGNKMPGQTISDFVPVNGNMDFLERAVAYLSGNNALLNIAPKYVPAASEPVSEVFRRQAVDEFAAAESELIQELAQVTEEQAKMRQQIKNQELLPSLQTTKQLETLERRRLELQHQQQLLQAKITKSRQDRQSLFVVANFIIPLFVLAILLLIFRLFRRRLAKQAERIINA